MAGMISYFKSLKEKFFSLQVPLEKRITYAMVIFAMMGELFGFVESLFLRLPLVAILLPLASFFFLLLLSIWGFKTKNTGLFAKVSIGICALVLFPVMFLANSGVDGGMVFYLMLTLVCIALVLHGKTRIIFFTLSLLEDVGLFLVYHWFPNIFIHMSEQDAFVDTVCSLVISCIILFFFSYTVSKQNLHDREKIQYLSDLYQKQANTDELTNLFNRRYFHSFLKLAIATVGDSGSLHIAMFDIDDFKQVNDKYGHPYGDVVLREFGRILQAKESLGATACRYGGEEFLLLIPKKSRDEALDIVRQILEETRNSIEIPDGKNITVSAGFITCRETMSFEKVMESVDKNLYLAKKAGKDRLISL